MHAEPACIRNSNNRRLGYSRVRHERGFEIGRRYPFSTGLDQVFKSVRDADRAPQSFVDEIPKTSVGKSDKDRLRELRRALTER